MRVGDSENGGSFSGSYGYYLFPSAVYVKINAII